MSDDKERDAIFAQLEMVPTDILACELLSRTDDGVAIYKNPGKEHFTINVTQDGKWLEVMDEIVLAACDIAYEVRRKWDNSVEFLNTEENDGPDADGEAQNN